MVPIGERAARRWEGQVLANQAPPRLSQYAHRARVPDRFARIPARSGALEPRDPVDTSHTRQPATLFTLVADVGSTPVLDGSPRPPPEADPMEASLEVLVDVTKEPTATSSRSIRAVAGGSTRHDLRPARPERRRQDHDDPADDHGHHRPRLGRGALHAVTAAHGGRPGTGRLPARGARSLPQDDRTRATGLPRPSSTVIRRPRRQARRPSSWIERVDLVGWTNKKVEELSKGMQQKIQLVGTVLHDPGSGHPRRAVLGSRPDQPGSVQGDADGVQGRKAGRSCFSTHIMEQAEKLCDHICLISHGRVVLEGELASIRRERGRQLLPAGSRGRSRGPGGLAGRAPRGGPRRHGEAPARTRSPGLRGAPPDRRALAGPELPHRRARSRDPLPGGGPPCGRLGSSPGAST